MGQSRPGDIIDRAIELAVKAHRKQVRKGTRTAYITHPFAVGVILAKAGCSEGVIAAGILHDTVEDGGVNLSRLRKEFGEKVACIVEKCTEPDKRRSWSKRKQYILDSVDRAGIEVKFVVCADKLHNMRTLARDYRVIGDRVWRRFRRGRKDQRWFYTSLLNSLRSKRNNASYERLYRELKRKVKKVFNGTQKGRVMHEQRK
jgi:(p)ppGpp synthase/HD superfamily hydrolase